jgi:4-nitrophenyl phosphatase/NagD protein
VVFDENASILIGDFMDTKLSGVKAVFLDLDGTIYLGGDLIAGALEFLSRCKEQGVRRFFLSNNSSRSVEQYVAKLNAMNIPCDSEDILLSTHDLLSWLAKNNITRTWAIATKGMCQMLEDAGISTRDNDPQYVVLGYDTEIDYNKISTASILMHRGIPLVASHPDMVCPSPDGGLPDVGAYLAMLKATTGHDPAHITGKPNPGMIMHKIEELGLQPSECAMVGDRLYTDMEMASQAGCVSVLVLSGEATLSDLSQSGKDISVVVDSVDDLLR